MNNQWRYLESRQVYDNEIVKVRLDRYDFLPGDIRKDYTVLEFGDWVNVIPVTPEGRVVMIRQFRHGIEGEALEIPGGMVNPGEEPALAAVRELAEETGYTGGDPVHLGTVSPNPAIQGNLCHTYLLEDAICTAPQDLDPTEYIRVELMDPDAVLGLIRNGQLDHGLVVAAFAFYLLHQGQKN